MRKNFNKSVHKQIFWKNAKAGDILCVLENFGPYFLILKKVALTKYDCFAMSYVILGQSNIIHSENVIPKDATYLKIITPE